MPRFWAVDVRKCRCSSRRDRIQLFYAIDHRLFTGEPVRTVRIPHFSGSNAAARERFPIGLNHQRLLAMTVIQFDRKPPLAASGQTLRPLLSRAPMKASRRHGVAFLYSPRVPPRPFRHRGAAS